MVGAASSLWDSILQEWIFYLYEMQPELILHAEVQSPDILLRRALERSMDIAFVFDDPQSGDLECLEVAHVPLLMVADKPDMDVEQAMQHQYIMVDWGTSFTNTHARYFPEAPIPSMRVMQGRLARDVILKRGGTAYIPEPMVRPVLDKGLLHIVKDAPVIERTVYALYHHKHEQLALIKMACDYFKSNTAELTVTA